MCYTVDLKHYYQSMDLQNTLIRFSGLKVYLKVTKIRLGEIGPELSLAKYFLSLLCVLLKITNIFAFDVEAQMYLDFYTLMVC